MIPDEAQSHRAEAMAGFETFAGTGLDATFERGAAVLIEQGVVALAERGVIFIRAGGVLQQPDQVNLQRVISHVGHIESEHGGR